MAKANGTDVDVDELGKEEVADTLVSELGEDITEGGTGGKGNDDATERRLRQLEQERIEQNVRARFMGELAADAEISEILRARQAGKKLKIVPAEEVEEKPIAAAEIDVMSNSQLMEHLETRLSKGFEAKMTRVIEPLVRQVHSVKAKARESEEQEADKEIAKLRRTARDFDLLQPSMVQISAKNPDLTVTEVYDIAKRRAGKVDSVADREKAGRVASERPTGGAARGSKRAEVREEQPTQISRGSFKSLVSKSLEKLDMKELGKADFSVEDED